MTLAHKTHQLSKPHKGFTLLEIIITLAIVAILMGSGFAILARDSKNELAEVSHQTQILAKETLREAKFTDRPQSIFISSAAIWAAPESSSPNDSDGLPPSSNVINIPDGVTIAYKQSNETSWTRVIKNEQPYIWAFSQTGLCESISIQLTKDDSVYETTFNSLTAGEVTDDY